MVCDDGVAPYRELHTAVEAAADGDGVTAYTDTTLAYRGSRLYFSVDRAKESASILSDRPTNKFVERYVVNEQGLLARETNPIEPVKIADEIAACVERFLG